VLLKAKISTKNFVTNKETSRQGTKQSADKVTTYIPALKYKSGTRKTDTNQHHEPNTKGQTL